MKVPGLVSVVVPAWNAAATLDAALGSARAQTYAAIEILVVDDGSTDATAAIARRHAAEDPRIRLFSQPNAGAAAARNRALAEARGEYVAPLDADDLWAPTKLERQVVALRAGGPQVALAYTWTARLDEQGRVIGLAPSEAEGDVLAALLRGNFVTNGSAALMRRAAIDAAGGYDAGLATTGTQHCEDLKLYLAIAECHRFAVVRDYLTGYRRSPGSASRDALAMVAAYDRVVAPVLRRHPHLAQDARTGRASLLEWLYWESLHVALQTGVSRDAAGVLVALIREAPARGLLLLRWLPRRLLREAADRLLPRRRAARAAQAAAARPFPPGPQAA